MVAFSNQVACKEMPDLTWYEKIIVEYLWAGYVVNGAVAFF